MDFPALRVVERSTPVTEARTLAVRHPLRAGDAIHLANALLLRRELNESVTFAAYDDRLTSAAKAEGLAVVP